MALISDGLLKQSGNEMPSLEGILSILDLVKKEFSCQSHLFNCFQDVWRKYCMKEADLHETLEDISRLFQGHGHLISRFNQLLPPGFSLGNDFRKILASNGIKEQTKSSDHMSSTINRSKRRHTRSDSDDDSAEYEVYSPKKRICLNPSVFSPVDICKFGSYEEFAFFDKVRHQVGNEETYSNFMRCLNLYTVDLISGADLMSVMQPFLVKSPSLMKQLKGFVLRGNVNIISQSAASNRKKLNSDMAMEIDYSSCRKYGASYRALPSCYEQPICSGRTDLCNEVLNDTWVSFPSWSEDTTSSGNSKISAYQEFLYRCEDERFELEIVIENISATVKVLEEVFKKISRMSPEEVLKFQLDDRLGGDSKVLQKKAIQRIYGDKAIDIIEGLKQKPYVAVPIALRRLKAKEQEWREHQEKFNKIWQDQNDKNYNKSLINEGGVCKQNECREMRSKVLLNEAEVIFEENEEQSLIFGVGHKMRGQEFNYIDRQAMVDATSLILHELAHLSTVEDDENFQMNELLSEIIPQLLYIPTSDDDTEVQLHFDKRCIPNEVYTLMFTNSHWFLFIRLHHRLCEILHQIRTSLENNNDHIDVNDFISPNGMKAKSPYEFVLNMFRSLVEGIVELPAYEDQLRKTLGSLSYLTFTLDRSLQNIMRQLQHLVSDETSKEMTKLFKSHSAVGGAGGLLRTSHHRHLAETSYRRQAFELLSDEYCFKMVFYKYEGRVTVELNDTDNFQSFNPVEVQQWTEYIDTYVNADVTQQELCNKMCFLNRNLKRRKNEPPKKIIEDNTQCQFNPNSFKMTFVANSWSYMYHCNALRKSKETHKTTTVFKQRKFSIWWRRWCHANVSIEQEKCCHDWMVGHKSDRIRCFEMHERERPPYRLYKKYAKQRHGSASDRNQRRTERAQKKYN